MLLLGFADTAQQRIGILRPGRVQQYQRTAAFTRNHRQHVAHGRAEIGPAPAQGIRQRIADLHPHQGGDRGVRLAADQREVQRMPEPIAISDELEVAMLRFDRAGVHALDGVLVL